MKYQLLFSEPVLTALTLFGPFPPRLLNWVARHTALQARLRPPTLLAAAPEFADCPASLPSAGPIELAALWAQLPELEDGAADSAFAFPAGTCLYQLEAATRLCQLAAAAGGRVVRLVPERTTLVAWLCFGQDYAQLVLHLYDDGWPFWAEVVVASTAATAEAAHTLLTRV